MQQLHQIADRDVLSLTPAHTVDEARALFSAQDADVAVVVHQGRALGLLSREDLERGPEAGSPAPRWKLLLLSRRHYPETVSAARIVGDLRYRPTHPFPPETSLELAATYARRTGAEHLLVLDQGRLVGVVPSLRLFGALAASD